MNLSIVTPLYETKEIFQKVFESVIDNTTCSFEFIIVYNHPPYPELAKYLDDISKKFAEVKILDPGKNIGCHLGCNYGFQNAKGEYFMKLDADTKIRRNNKWSQMMIDIFNQEDKLALLAPEIVSIFNFEEPLRQGGKYEQVKIGKYNVDLKADGILGFSAVMFSRKIWNEFGPMGSHYYIAGRPITREYYGGEESDWSNKARSKNYKIGIARDVEFLHLGRSAGTDPAFGVWKFFYAHGMTNNDMPNWIKELNMPKNTFVKTVMGFGYGKDTAEEAYESIMKRKK